MEFFFLSLLYQIQGLFNNFNLVKMINLSYINDMAGGNNEIVFEMIDVFIDQVPEFLEEMNACYEKKDWYNLGLIAHKAKSSVAILGMESQAKELKHLEILAKDGAETEQYLDIIKGFENDCQIAIKELNQYKNKNS